MYSIPSLLFKIEECVFFLIIWS